MVRGSHHGAMLARRHVRSVVCFLLIAGSLLRRREARHEPLGVARGDHTRVGSLRHRARVAPHPWRPLLAGRDDRRVPRQRDERGDPGGGGGHRLRQHPRGCLRDASRLEDRLHAGARPGPLGSRPRHRGSADQHADQRHERRHRPHARRRERGQLRRGLAPLVVRRRRGDPGGGAHPARPLRRLAQLPPSPAARLRGRRAVLRAGERQRARVPRGRLAVPIPHLSVRPLGRSALQAARRRGVGLHRRRHRHVGRRRRAGAARRRDRHPAGPARPGRVRRRRQSACWCWAPPSPSARPPPRSSR